MDVNNFDTTTSLIETGTAHHGCAGEFESRTVKRKSEKIVERANKARFRKGNTGVIYSPFFKNLAFVAILAAVYFVAGKLGLMLAFVHANATAVWPPTGITMAALLVLGYRVWPGIFFGAFLVNVTTAGSIATSIGIATGNTLEGLVGAYLVNRFAHGRNAFDRPRDIFNFAVLAGIGSTAVSAAIGVTSLCLGSFANWTNYGSIWLTWWLGDAMGNLILAPLLVLWIANPRIRWSRERALEAMLLLFSLIFVSLFVFDRLFFTESKNHPLVFLCVPILIWAAFRFGPREAATAIFVLSGIAIWGTLDGFGPFARGRANESLLLLHGFIGVMAVMTMSLAAVVSERKRAGAALRLAHDELDLRVQQRTAALSQAVEALEVEIAERKSAEAALRASEACFRAVVETAKDAILSADNCGNIIFWNHGAETIFGYSAEEVAGEPLTLIMPKRFHQAHQNGLKRLLTTGKSNITGKTIELVGRRKDGSEFPLELSLANWKTGNEICFTAIIRDITERTQAEEALAESRKELREYIDNMSTFNAKVALDGKLLLVNKTAELASGFSHDELMKINFLEGPWWAFDPEVQARVREVFRKAASGTTVNYDERLRIVGDQIIVINFSLVPVLGGEGQVRYVLAEGRDITAQKMMAEDLAKSQTRLAEAQQLAHLGSWEWDIVNNKITWSDELYRIYGLKPEEFDATYETFLQHTHPNDRELVDQTVQKSCFEQQPFAFDYRIVRPDGSVRTLHGQGQVVLDTGGKPVRMVSTAQDITERKRAEEEIQTLNAELEQRVLQRTAQLEAANKELEAFSYSVSHDLSTPLRGIDGFSQALLEDYAHKMDAQGQDYLQRVRSASQRMAQLIHAMLNLSRVTRTEMRHETVDLSTIARIIAAEFQQMEPKRRVEFVIANSIVAHGDARLLQVMMENLFGNAWKFTGKQTAARIEFGMIPPGVENESQPVYFVRDNGAGFDMAYADKLFRAFQRLHAMTEFDGTGIGLATVLRIIQRHGGRIWAEGEVERGATFCFTLPMQSEEHRR